MKHEALMNAVVAQPGGPTENQRKAAQEFDLPDTLAARLRGGDYEEIRADAQLVADAVKGQPEADVPEHVRLARRAIESAKNNPNTAELHALGMVKPGHQALADALDTEETDE